KKFIKVMPIDYKRVLSERAKRGDEDSPLHAELHSK
ncbi:MAG: hypothetical protein ACI9HK_002744, partial [Pirellulaceae bacterium]